MANVFNPDDKSTVASWFRDVASLQRTLDTIVTPEFKRLSIMYEQVRDMVTDVGKESVDLVYSKLHNSKRAIGGTMTRSRRSKHNRKSRRQ